MSISLNRESSKEAEALDELNEAHQSRRSSLYGAGDIVAPRLDTVLRDIGQNAAFAIYLEEQVRHGAALANFYLAATHLKDMRPTSDDYRMSAEDLYQTFLAPNCKRPLPLPSLTVELREKYKSILNSPNRLPQDLYGELRKAIFQHIYITYFPMFLLSLSYEHLETEAILLHPVATVKFMKTARSLYREEYPLFYADYEAFRSKMQEGFQFKGQYQSLNEKDRKKKEEAELKEWVQERLEQVNNMIELYFKTRAEFAIFLESEIKKELMEGYQKSKKNGTLEPLLLNVLLTIKDWSVEVMKVDILPQYHKDCAERPMTQLMKSIRSHQRKSSIQTSSVPTSPANQAHHLAVPEDRPPRRSFSFADDSDQGNSKLAHAHIDVSTRTRRHSGIVVGPDHSPRGKTTSIPFPLPHAYQNNHPTATPVNSGASSPHNLFDEDEKCDSEASQAQPNRVFLTFDSNNPRSFNELSKKRASITTLSHTQIQEQLAKLALNKPANGARSSLIASPVAPVTSPSSPPTSTAPFPMSPFPNHGLAGSVSDIPTLQATGSDGIQSNNGSSSDSSTSAQSSPQFKTQKFDTSPLSSSSPAAPPTGSSSSSSSGTTASAPIPIQSASAAHPYPEINLTRFGQRSKDSVDYNGSSPELLNLMNSPSSTISPSVTSSPSALAISSAPTSPQTLTRPSSQAAVERLRRRSLVNPFEAVALMGIPGLTAIKVQNNIEPERGGRRSVHFSLTELGPSGDDLSRVKRSILKRQAARQRADGKPSESYEQVMARVFKEREAESTRLLKAMKEGAMILKYNSAGNPAERWFNVSDDGTELCWCKVDEKTGQAAKTGLFNRVRRKPLADCIRVRYGSANSKRLTKYQGAQGFPWCAFSLFFEDRTLDLVAPDENAETAAIWFQGLQSLAPLSTSYLSKGGFLWRRMQMKIKYYADRRGIPQHEFLEALIAEARRDVPLGILPTVPLVEAMMQGHKPATTSSSAAKR